MIFSGISFKISKFLFMFLSRIAFCFLLMGLAPLAHAANPDAAPRKEAVRGYLVDLVCVKEEAGKLDVLGPNHTKKCLQMPACVQGGYAVLLPSNEVLAFDEHGNELARKLVASRHQEKGFVVKATGTREGDLLHVLKIE
jgi:hypothetical protein